ncbi:hypothetical protein ACOMHN_001961 [Nucella lapillus]
MVGQLPVVSTKESGPQTKSKTLTALPLNDFLFTEDVLLEVSAWSRIDCSKKCVETEGCGMCTFRSSHGDPPGYCRLHSQLHNSTDQWKIASGAKSLALYWSCAEGYEMRCGRCLRVVHRNVSYTDAQQGCRDSNQGQLVMPKTFAEVYCAHMFMMENGVYKPWIGASDLKSPGAFRWNDGTPLPDNSSLWNKDDDPDPEKANPGRDCVYMFADRSLIFDYHCSARRSYVCQKDLM